MTSSAQFVLESYSSIINAISKEGSHYSDGPSHGNISFPINSKIGSAELPLPYFTDKFYENLCNKVTEIMKNEPTLLLLPAPIVVVGDLHGSLLDFLRIIIYFEYNSNNTFLFLGDFVDRGQFSLEILTILYSLKILYPKRFYFIRGNHEFENICSNYGFKEEIKMKSYDNIFNKGNCQDSNIINNSDNDSVFQIFINTFLYMPLAAVIDDEIFCVHGGISPYLTNLGKLSKIERPISNYTTLPLIEDIMWADVSKTIKHDSYITNTRGTGTVFSETQLDHFFRLTGLKSVVRGHQYIDCGVEFLFNKKLVTLFTASSYNVQKGKPKNKCGALVIGSLPSRPVRRESYDSSSFDSESFESTLESPSIISYEQNEEFESQEPKSNFTPIIANLNFKQSQMSYEAPIIQRTLSPRIPAIAKPNEKFVIDDNNSAVKRKRTKSILDIRKANCNSQFASTTPFTRASSIANSQKTKIIDQIPKLNFYNSNTLSSHCSVGNLSSFDNFLNSENNNSHQKVCPLAPCINSSNNSNPQDKRKKAKSVFITPSIQQNQCLTPRRSNGISCSHSMPLDIPALTELSPELAMQEFIFDSLDPLKFEEVNYVEKSRHNAPLCMKLASEQKRIGYPRRRNFKSVEFVTSGRYQTNSRRDEPAVAEKA